MVVDFSFEDGGQMFPYDTTWGEQGGFEAGFLRAWRVARVMPPGATRDDPGLL